jgi:hypothetical protein
MRLSSLAMALGLAVAVVAGMAVHALASDAGGIEGSYRLVSRNLPNGTVVRPPDVVGFDTYTKTYRNFNVMWKDEKGNPVSLSYVASYELSKDKYCEKPIFWLQNNLGAPGLKYTWPAEKSECSPVTRTAGKISFSIKGEPPVVVFDSKTMTATAKGAFVDHWEKVD